MQKVKSSNDTENTRSYFLAINTIIPEMTHRATRNVVWKAEFCERRDDTSNSFCIKNKNRFKPIEKNRCKQNVPCYLSQNNIEINSVEMIAFYTILLSCHGKRERKLLFGA